MGQSRQQRVLQQRCCEAVQQVLLAAAASGSAFLTKEELHTRVQELLKVCLVLMFPFLLHYAAVAHDSMFAVLRHWG